MPCQFALRILILPAALFAAALAPVTVFAEGGQIRIQADLEYIYSDIETKDESTGEKTDSTYSYFQQKYNVDIQKELYPYLYFRGGGYFELIDSTSDSDDGPKTGFEERTNRLWAELNLTNPLYRASAAYRRRNFKFDPRDFSTIRITRDEYSGFWKWKPVGFPSLDVDFNRFHTWDDDDTRDSLLNLLVVKSRYDYDDFSADYTYTRSDQDQTFPDIRDPDETSIDQDTLTQIHNGGVLYSTELFGDRLEITSAARLNYDKLEPSGTGPVRMPTTSPGAAFYLLDDRDPSTLTVVDASHPLSVVNIGRNAPTNPVAVGLDFGAPTEVDTIHVMPVEDVQDPALASPGEIASVARFFIWTVFISNDQVNWTEQAVTSANYSVFDNRFEISFFPQAFTPYIKVVTTPVSTAPGEIRIGDLEGFTTIDAGSASDFETWTQTYNLGLRWAITDRTSATYESFLRILDTKPFDRDKTTLVNGISAQHEFNQMFFGYAKVQRTDTDQSNRDDTVRHTYTASLTADYLPTLNQTLVYSGDHDKEDGRTGFTNSILLRTNADVYRDWSVSLDLGYSAKSPLEGPDTTSTRFRLATDISPHRTLDFTVDYLGSYKTEDGGDSAFDHIASLQAFWVPFRTLSFFASVNIRDFERESEGRRVRQQYSANWSPFQDGQLNFLLGYNETIDEDNNDSRIVSPEVRWQLTRTTLLTLAFDYGTLESNTATRDVKVFRANFRTIF